MQIVSLVAFYCYFLHALPTLANHIPIGYLFGAWTRAAYIGMTTICLFSTGKVALNIFSAKLSAVACKY
jgi:hypothetical protein